MNRQLQPAARINGAYQITTLPRPRPDRFTTDRLALFTEMRLASAVMRPQSLVNVSVV